MTAEIEIVRIRVDPQGATQLAQAVEAARGGYLAAPACHGVELLLSGERDELVAIVTWDSAQAHAEALRTPHAPVFFESVAAFALGAPDVRRYRPL
jgi:quinol monooxygenase YgiN